MASLGGDAFSDGALAPEREKALRAGLETAKARVRDFYGDLAVARPRAILCGTQRCRSFFGGSSQRSHFVPAGNWVPGAPAPRHEWPTIVLGFVDEAPENILTHELAHAEFRARLGPGWAPAWFHEGLATLIGRDDSCPAGHATDPALDLAGLEENSVWLERTENPEASKAAYCTARNEVAAWMKTHGRDGLLALLAGVRGGKDFGDLYGPLPYQTLKPKQIATAIDGNAKEILACFDGARARGGLKKDGEIDFAWTVMPDGCVIDVEITKNTTDDENLGPCISGRIARWVFPRVRGQTHVGRYPFLFRLEGADASEGGAGAPPLDPPPLVR
jgi:hypothetical protein